MDSDREFSLIEFGRYLRLRGRWLAITCGAAVAASFGLSLTLPKRYTATASVLIEPPAGNDPRAATALSPVYLESLKTFERIASGDSLFVDALAHWRVPEAASGRSFQSLKHDILSVIKPPNTNILEIDVTLQDARLAQALAQYIAERTVALSRSVDSLSEDDATKEARSILAAAETRLNRAQAARDRFATTDPVEALEDEVASDGELRFRIQGDLADARAELAEATARLRASGPAANATRLDIAAVQARVEQLQGQDADATEAVNRKSTLLDLRRNQRDALEVELRAARSEYEAAENKLNDIRASAAFRGERLQVIDPGIVPNRPSSPNMPLHVLVALLSSLLASIFFLAMRFGQEQHRQAVERSAYQAQWQR